ncbi:hypothetical protein [Roseibium sp. Sym1]|uniref:hypothetical protein n=1 Tax=Roseibium sp. Sym1 TaxID=3016006 RepID=UPI0022B2EE74|nr:hypothetical protein [Roseibium sp. Sym1]
MADIIRIAPQLTDDDIVSWIGDGAFTCGVAMRFGWDISDTRRRLDRLARAGRLTRKKISKTASCRVTGGQHVEWVDATVAEIQRDS